MKQWYSNKFYLTILTLAMFGIMCPGTASAQSAAEEAREQREAELDRLEEERRERIREDIKEEKAQTAEDVIELLKSKVEAKRKAAKRKRLLRTTASAGLTHTWETNPTSANSGEKDDPSLEKSFTANWIPTFSNQLSGNLGISYTRNDYSDNPTLDTENKTVTADVTYRSPKGKFSFNPGVSYEWMDYRKAKSSDYDQFKSFVRLTHYFTKQWNFGGKYEYGLKDYTSALARDGSASDIIDKHREEQRHTVESWVKRNIGKYSVKLKAKSYRNVGNDEFQDFYHYYAHKGDLTLSGRFLEDKKLSLSYTADFEKKMYDKRLAESTARDDRVTSHRLSASYGLPKDIKLTYTSTYKTSSSNASTGEFDNFTNKIGLRMTF